MFHEEIRNFSGRNFQLSKPPLRCNYVNSCWLTAMLDNWFYLEPMTVQKLHHFSVPLKVKLLIFSISIVTDSSFLNTSSVTAIELHLFPHPKSATHISNLLHCVKFKNHSHVRLSVTLRTWSARLCLSVGFSRQEYWSGLLCPSPGNLTDPWI